MPATVAQSKARTRSLPKELWGEVLWHVGDPFDLWVCCRQVSFTFRQEAERAFRLRLLPHLVICYVVSDKAFGYFEDDYEGSCVVQLRLDTDHTSLDASLGRFHLETKSFYVDPARLNNVLGPKYVNFISEAHRALIIRRCLDWDDVDALDREESHNVFDDGYHALRILFEPTPNDNLEGCLGYINDVEVPEMSYHLNTFTRGASSLHDVHVQKQGYADLNWKKLLTEFFAEEIFVRRKLAQVGARKPPLTTLRTLLDKSLATIAEYCPSLQQREHGHGIGPQDKRLYEAFRLRFIESSPEIYKLPNFHQPMYEAAYDARLRKAYGETGLDVLPAGNGIDSETTKYKEKLAKHVKVLQEYRDDRFKAFLEEYWLYNVGELVVEETPAEDETEEDDEDDDIDHGSSQNGFHDEDDYAWDPYGEDERLEADFSVKDWKPLRKREQKPQSKKVLKKHKKGKWKW